ncbi:hypothetical protein FOZ60_005759 [Perkinsus olseni]|uniref:Uncharacterized protein n=1 Tax=Perkinsus olseni TaxID=32597 RepID=A0A7J6NQS1_PEROL|nr:hypothetical protein FOZ60_005759 [Perkinsus olseni]
MLSSVTSNVPVASIADIEALATSSDVPDALREVLEASVGSARISTLKAHVRDCLRASAARPGRPLKDGELVVWRRPECRPVEGTVRLVSGVSVEDGPFCYLGSLAGFITRLRLLGSPPDHSVSVSACHLEARHAFVDRDRPALAVETTIPFSSVKPDEIILARLSCDADAVGRVVAERIYEDGLPVDSLVIQVYDSHDGKKFFPVWISHDGSTYTVLMRIGLTPTNMLKDASRSALVEAGYLEA